MKIVRYLHFIFIRTRIRIRRYVVKYKVRKAIKNLKFKPAMGNYLDNIAKLHSINRMMWMDEPDIEPWKYRYCPTYAFFNDNLLLYNYKETDESFRKRVVEQIKNAKN